MMRSWTNGMQSPRGARSGSPNFRREATRTGIPSLKVGFNRVFGYYIEVTHVHAAKIPADYQRKQTLKNAERYATPELKEHEENVLSAQERIYQREYELFVALRDQVAGQADRLMQTAEVLATSMRSPRLPRRRSPEGIAGRSYPTSPCSTSQKAATRSWTSYSLRAPLCLMIFAWVPTAEPSG